MKASAFLNSYRVFLYLCMNFFKEDNKNHKNNTNKWEEHLNLEKPEN